MKWFKFSDWDAQHYSWQPFSLSLSLSLPLLFTTVATIFYVVAQFIPIIFYHWLENFYQKDQLYPAISFEREGQSKFFFHSINLWKIYHGKPTNRYWHQWRLLRVHGVRASPPWRELEPRMAQTPASHYVQWQNPSEFLHQGRVHLFLYH